MWGQQRRYSTTGLDSFLANTTEPRFIFEDGAKSHAQDILPSLRSSFWEAFSNNFLSSWVNVWKSKHELQLQLHTANRPQNANDGERAGVV